ncbi:MAG: tRNA (N6-threonylcarbamoyladenosine(37)-N6)-methyltransferase TrmO [Mailhella sp.]|nr:tRNA (N6-threonylcarbamoyladenosine(37)-N6)-methyltransferase TrmO [Mailhella sp.]
MQVIARMHNDLKEKFGVPRQSGLAPHLSGTVVFEPGYRNPEALRGLEGFSHIWLIWQFSKNKDVWSPTVRPPRLGGNKRIGVFACRSPFRPNPLGLSCVKISGIDLRTPDGPVIHVLGADLTDGTPIFDIKPYLPSADCIPEASSGFAGSLGDKALLVEFSPHAAGMLTEDQKLIVKELVQQDPRPRYQNDPSRLYGMKFAEFDIRFKIIGNVAVICEIINYFHSKHVVK